MDPDGAKEVAEAATRLGSRLYRTPVQRAFWVGAPAKVYLKLESEQVTNSFKARGALNKVLSLTKEQRAQGIITASTGNHALAMANACEIVRRETGEEFKYEIVLPETASAAKVDLLKAMGAPLRFHGQDCLLAENEALRDAKENGKFYVSPYNDAQVMAGQGTIACELLEQLPEAPAAVFVPVGGGGLIGGIATWIKARSPGTKVIGCSPVNDAHMAHCVRAGRFVDVDTYKENGGLTLSEGTAGAVETDSITFPVCQQLVDEWVELTEDEIGAAVVDMLVHHHKAIEGSAGLGIAACRKLASRFADQTVAIVICGGNVRAEVMRDLLVKYVPADNSS
ncbi:Threonine dehydratase [Hondaea fermentalgiana]|uniref:Threonine dehydratase n=1 Tax=Hondaea fermentalgiana TaxID=2315210 RepID=A0A2R5G961_9STRA|nr:Threonine dehydratase [Hondaea fermentalgiana]|eukprot:GBG24204.1 Threonine dehydratase [Hondaea fermentalgiana]